MITGLECKLLSYQIWFSYLVIKLETRNITYSNVVLDFFVHVKMTEFKTMKMETDKAHREKIENMQKRHSTAMDTLQVSTPVLKH